LGRRANQRLDVRRLVGSHPSRGRIVAIPIVNESGLASAHECGAPWGPTWVFHADDPARSMRGPGARTATPRGSTRLREC
jgi:hypothetical protein